MQTIKGVSKLECFIIMCQTFKTLASMDIFLLTETSNVIGSLAIRSTNTMKYRGDYLETKS